MSYTREEIYAFIIQRSLEWANWPLYISLSVFPVLLIYIPWWQLLMGFFVFNWIWRLVRCRYQSIGLAMLGAFSIPLRWPISIIMAIYFFITKSYFLSFLSIFWPILATYIVLPIFLPIPPLTLLLIQEKFREKIFTLLLGEKVSFLKELFDTGKDLPFDKSKLSDFMLIQQKYLECLKEKGNLSKELKEYLKEDLPKQQEDNSNWKFLGFDALGNALFYDPKNVFISENIIKGWVKAIYSKKGKSSFIKLMSTTGINFEEIFKNLDYVLFSYEIDCSQKKCRLLETIDYASNGSIIISGPNPEREWKLIPSNSIMEDLFKKVCR